jgi:hypothetical protein
MGGSRDAVRGEVRYRIDAHDTLVGFSRAWDDFARANAGPELVARKARGRPLWRFIHDADTRHLHRRLLEVVRAGRALWRLPFRCDAPDLRRHMEMDIVPLAGGHVEYRCRLLRAEPRAPVPVDYAATGRLVKMCSWCKRVETAPGVWKELEAAIRELGLFEAAPPPGVSHGICRECQARYYPGALEAEAGGGGDG